MNFVLFMQSCTCCIKISHVLSLPINLACIASATIVLDLHRMRKGYLSCPFSPHRLWRVKQDLPVSHVSKLTAWRGPRPSLVSVERAPLVMRAPYLRAWMCVLCCGVAYVVACVRMSSCRAVLPAYF